MQGAQSASCALLDRIPGLVVSFALLAMLSASKRCFDEMLFAAHITPLAWMSCYQNCETRFFVQISFQGPTPFHAFSHS
jgi:hypothetical protein